MSQRYGIAKRVQRIISNGSTSLTLVKAQPADLTGWSLSNTNADPRYLKIYHAASTDDVTVGTTVPRQTILIPGNAKGTGNNFEMLEGVDYPNGIVVALTALPADNDATVVAANEVIAHVYFK